MSVVNISTCYRSEIWNLNNLNKLRFQRYKEIIIHQFKVQIILFVHL